MVQQRAPREERERGPMMMSCVLVLPSFTRNFTLLKEEYCTDACPRGEGWEGGRGAYGEFHKMSASSNMINHGHEKTFYKNQVLLFVCCKGEELFSPLLFWLYHSCGQRGKIKFNLLIMPFVLP